MKEDTIKEYTDEEIEYLNKKIYHSLIMGTTMLPLMDDIYLNEFLCIVYQFIEYKYVDEDMKENIFNHYINLIIN